MGDLIEVDRSVNIGVICLAGLDSFLPDIVHKLEENYNVRSYCGNDMQEVENVIAWCDIVWVEWANELAIHVTTKVDLTDKKVIIRLHSYEALSGYCQQIDWNKVTTVIFVAQHVYDILKKQKMVLPSTVNVRVIANGVDTDKFRRVVDERSN